MLEDEEEEDIFKFIPEVWLDIKAPYEDDPVKTGFTVRPFAVECLRLAN